jgi:hypothetical protein
MEAKRVTRSDRMLATGAAVHPVSGCSIGAGSDQTHRCLRPVMLTYSDVMARGTVVTSGCSSAVRARADTGLRLVTYDQTQ